MTQTRSLANRASDFISVKDFGATGVNLTTGVLTGTTGTDNRLNISSSSGVIYVENRLGAATQIAVKTLPASDLYV